MAMEINLQLISVMCAIIACLCTIWVARRTGTWRETDDAKKLVGRVDDVVMRVGTLEEKVRGLPTQSQVASLEERMKGLATKAEIAAIQSDVHSLVREVGKVDAGVTRIEAFLMENRS